MDTDLGTARGSIEIDASSLSKVAGALDFVGKRMVAVGALAIAGFGLAVKASADFEQQMSRFKAVANSTTGEMDKIREKALQLGRDSAYGATEVINAFAELGYAGVSTKEILNGMGDAVVYLAASAEVPLKDAATGLVNTMRQFHIPATKAVDAVNEIARAANASTIDMKDLITSLRYAGPVAAALHMPLRDVAQTLAILGNNGIRGSTAGTSLRGVLIALTPTSEKAANKMRELGLITENGANLFFTAEGKMKSMSQVSQILQEHTKHLTDEQKKEAFTTIFQRRAMASAIVLADGGSKAYRDLAGSAQYNTTAQKLMQEKLDNLNGSLKILKASLETFAIGVGSGFQGPLKFIADLLRDFTNLLIQLPQPVQTVLASLLLLGGGFLLVGGLMSRIGASAIRAYTAFQTLGEHAVDAYKAIASGTGAVGMLGRVAAGAAAFAAGWYIGSQIIEHFGAKGWEPMIKKLEDMHKAEKDLVNVQDKDLLPSFNKVIETNIKTVDAWNKLHKAFGDNDNIIPTLKDKYRLLGEQLRTFKDLAGQSFDKAVLLFQQMKNAGVDVAPFAHILYNMIPDQKALNKAQEEGADKVKILTGNYEDAIAVLDKYQDALRAQVDKEFAAELAVLDQADAIQKLTDARQAAIDAGGQDQAKNEDVTRALIAAEKQIQDTAFALRDKREAELEAQGATDAHGRATYETIASLQHLRDTLSPDDPLRVWLDQYIERLGKASGPHDGSITLNTSDAEAKLGSLEARINKVLGFHVVGDTGNPNFTLAPNSSTDPLAGLGFLDPSNPNNLWNYLAHHASGGKAKGTFWAGEEGAELISLGAGKSAYVTAYPDVMKLAAGLQKVKSLQASLGPAASSGGGNTAMMTSLMKAVQSNQSQEQWGFRDLIVQAPNPNPVAIGFEVARRHRVEARRMRR